MSQIVSIDDFESAVKSILDEYGDKARDGLKDSIKEQGKETKKAIQEASPKRSGAYKKGWSVKNEETRLGAKATVYNKKAGMPHLLEHGHTVRNGKTIGANKKHFVSPSPAGGHIKPAEDAVEEQLIKKIKEKLEG